MNQTGTWGRRSARLMAGAAVAAAAMSAGAATAPEQIDVYKAGQDGYAFYRIPAAVRTTSGTVLAFAEGRKLDRHDAGDIDLVVKRSRDGGRRWEPLQTVWDDEKNTCGNPAPVVDAATGRVWLFSTWNLGTDSERMIMDGVSTDTRRVFVTYSDDDGASWAKPEDVTGAVKRPEWRWYATGPGHGIQLTGGRIVIPANHSAHEGGGHPYRSHAILSDDGGRSWRLGGSAGERTNESTVAELEDGRVYLNMRSYHELGRRAVTWSKDGGESWDGVFLDPALVEPVCQASVLRHAGPGGKVLHLFSNPASRKRERMTVRVSRDSCRTWTPGKVIHAGAAAYSDLCPLAPETVGCLYERDDEGQAYGKITFARMDLDWLLSNEQAEARP